jgi:hypothetical protein
MKSKEELANEFWDVKNTHPAKWKLSVSFRISNPTPTLES